ncbi:hypothetical protein DFJ73DRAFT_390523 [Zopfochytrium polystomum]|nr:hypothetical protein DFJ73DRAFT_390523 [Zopfochytrium polystomum]
MFFLTRANLFLTAGGLSAAEGWVTASAKAAAMAGSGRAWSRLIGTALGVVTRGNGLTIPPEVFFVRILLPFYVILGFGNHQQISLIETVSEKEKRTKEGLLMQGLSINVYWMSKIVLYGTYAAVSSFLFAYVVAPCYPTSNFVIIALIIGLFDAANIASSLALSAVFRSAKSAAVFGSLLPFIFLVLTGVAFGYELLPSETAVVLVSILLYPVGVFYGLLKVHQGELRGNGTSWGNLWTGDGVGIYLVVLALSVALYTGLAIYLDQIIPQGFGTTKAWDFPLHRFRRRANRHPSIPKPPSAHPARDPAKFQPDPVGKTPLVVLENVDRSFWR